MVNKYYFFLNTSARNYERRNHSSEGINSW